MTHAGIPVDCRSPLLELRCQHTEGIARASEFRLRAVIDYAKRVKDWPLLEQAVDAQIDLQTEFVAWWREKVTPGQSPGRKGKSNAVRGSILDVSQAEEATGISQQQVSKWAKRLKGLPSYRARLFGAAWR